MAPSRDLRTLADPPSQHQLIAALEGAGQTPLTLSGTAGDTIVVLPHGGRVLGLYSAQSAANFLWTSATLSSAELAREHFASNKWCNSGGDRTWLTPEVDFFYPHYPNTAKLYFQPRELDPGSYTAILGNGQIALENTLTLRSFRRGWTATVRITKTVCASASPLDRNTTAGLARELEFAGYRLRTQLEMLTAEDECCQIGLWNLLQLPGGGEMLTPVYRPTEPVVYFGDIPAGHLRTDSRCIRYQMTAPHEQKIGVDALAVSGRAGYLLRDGDDPETATLVVRNFAVDPSGSYVDVPLHSPDLTGHAFQACNIDADYLGRFAELEYHAPAIGGAEGSKRCVDVSEVWAYRGTREAIARATYELLGITV